MALPPQMVDMAMGPGGSSELMPEEMQIELPMGDELPEGIELAGEEDQMVMVEAEVYDHNANLAEILKVLGYLVLITKSATSRSWEPAAYIIRCCQKL